MLVFSEPVITIQQIHLYPVFSTTFCTIAQLVTDSATSIK
jgi:hypothetical protein